jgi:large subunit ribosomal protein L4
MALSVDVRSVEGSVLGAIELDEQIFGIQPNVPVMHQVVTAQLAAARAGTHSTKTRAEVTGGGKKPFRQKGTGRARQGSTRAPHWSGGGVALGPKPRSYRQKTPRKMIQLALRSALSDRAAGERVVVVDEWPWSAPKTADARRALAALALEGKVLVVLDPERHGEAFLSFRNLSNVQLLLEGELNAYDVLCNDWVVFTRSTLPGESVEVPAQAPVAEVEAEEETEDQAPADETALDETGAEGEDEARDETPDESQDQPEADESEETPEP